MIDDILDVPILRKSQREAVKSQLKDMILKEVIGGDYKITGLEHPEVEEWHNTRNKLKAEQRTKLSELFERK